MVSRKSVFTQPMGNRGVGSLQAVGELAGGGVVDVEAFEQVLLEAFHGLFQAFDFHIALTRHGGAGDVQVADIHQAAFANGGGAEDHVLQLPHVARPAVAQQGRVSAGARRQTGRWICAQACCMK